MEDRLSSLEKEVQRLSAALDRVEERLGALEDAKAVLAREETPASAVEAVPAGLSSSEIARGITLVGRTLLILGGGYLLRALTEAETLAPLGGAALGILYALFWLALADRAGARANTMSAAFYGGAAILVAFPLLWETTARFQLFSPTVSAACLGLVSFFAIAVAWRRRLRSFAWVTVAGATLTSVALVFGTRQLAPFGLLLVLLGVATLWLAYRGHWPVVHWAVAGVADLTVLGMVVGVAMERSETPVWVAASIALSLFALFVGSFAFRLLTQREEPGPFEVLQTGAATAFGYGGALAVTAGPSAVVLSVLGPVAGALAYAVALSNRAPTARTATFFEGLGLLLVLIGGFALPDQPALFFALAGVALVWLGTRTGRAMPGLHGALLIVASATASGLVGQVAYALAARASRDWPAVTLSMVVTLAGAASAYALHRVEPGSFWLARWRLARLVLLGTLVLALGGFLLAAIAALSPPVAADAAVLATVRTAVLALAALVLGGLARSSRFREAGWLVYPVLLLGGIKLAVEDFPEGRALTLFVALALYGGALILAPLVSRQAR